MKGDMTEKEARGFADKMMKDVKKDLKNRTKQEKQENIESLKAEYEKTCKQIDELQKELKEEILQANINSLADGNVEKSSAKVKELCKQIDKKTKAAAKYKSQIPSARNSMLAQFEKCKNAINKYFDVMKESCNRHIENGLSTLKGLGNTFRAANEQFKAIGKAAYVNLDEKVQEQNRAYIARACAIKVVELTDRQQKHRSSTTRRD